ncbi:DUF2975 domain-containing protein [Streptomyces sp. NPDC054949]|uniref:DUF2975 domain-containing protein n=1 Tax=unclassified Streptomyces TaxID=2593676 RepID=UPI0022516578|nr:DUF2975 domain-containing protein [Streptomyces sp. NBC_00424]MCX5071527.1 DUF2975 domain-containing protein [Streptomyces sp. NBC_00424]WUD45074.1 DUF2975 domain-containing protein [Streptomyces sp. NBC_00513]
MGRLAMLALRAVLVMLAVGTAFVQAVMVPLFAIDLEDLDPGYAYLRIPLLALTFLGVVAVQVTLVCVWRLVTMVKRGTVFSHAAFRYVDVVIGAVVAAALLVFALGVLLAPGEAVPPGMVLLIGGAGVGVLGVALIVFVLRMLLARAVARDVEATHLQAELDEVI